MKEKQQNHQIQLPFLIMTAARLPQLPIPAQRRGSGRVAMGKTNKRAAEINGSESSQVPSQKEAATDRSADPPSERSTDRKSK